MPRASMLTLTNPECPSLLHIAQPELPPKIGATMNRFNSQPWIPEGYNYYKGLLHWICLGWVSLFPLFMPQMGRLLLTD